MVIIDTSEIVDFADFGGMLYELKKLNVREGTDFQFGNGAEMLIHDGAFVRCRGILQRFGAVFDDP